MSLVITKTGVAATTFPSFGKLPKEIRLMIWEEALESSPEMNRPGVVSIIYFILSSPQHFHLSFL